MNLNDFVRYWAAYRPQYPAIIFGDQVQSWAQVDALSDALARGLAAQGVGKGDRVGVLMKNRPELALTALATLKLGAICVPLNFRLTGIELLPMLADSQCKLVLVEDALASLLEPSITELSFAIFATETRHHRSYDELLVANGPVPIVDVSPDDGAFICYTSGTTGVQKGALLTHRSVIHPGRAKVVAEGLTWRDRMLVAVPLVYTGAMVSCFMQFVVYAGGTMVLEADFDPERYLSVIERHRVTALTTVPVVWERLAQSAEFRTRDISSLVSAHAGGAPVSLDLIQTYREKGIQMIQSYGLTEASGLVATMPPEEAIRQIGHAGRPIMGTQVRILDENGNPVASGKSGEIAVRGEHVMRGYWNKPEATARTIIDGWLHTGDVGLINDEGYLKILDRTKDMLISGGINVYPAEIERALAGIEGIIDLAVIGVADQKWGEVPLLVLHTNRNVAEVLADVERIGLQQLAGFKRPKFAVVSHEPLPRTFSGKLSKPILRAIYPLPPQDAIPLFQRNA